MEDVGQLENVMNDVAGGKTLPSEREAVGKRCPSVSLRLNWCCLAKSRTRVEGLERRIRLV